MSSPFASLALVWLALAVPCALAEREPRESELAREGERLVRVVVAVACAWGVAAALWYLVVLRGSIGSMDFFLHVCSARDMVERPLAGDDPILACYHLFPGVFQFWRAAIRVGGASLGNLQWAYVALLLANAVLVGAITGRATKSAACGVFAALWYGKLLSSLEVYQGFLEPIATLPLLAGVLAWGGEPLRGRTGAARAIALGAGLGLALECRQQAGVLALAAITLLSGLRVREERRHELRCLALVPVAAVGAFLFGILWEGHGLLPLERGLAFAGSYRPVGEGLVANVLALGSVVGPVAPGYLLAAAMALRFAAVVWFRRRNSSPTSLVVFASFAALLALLPLARRPYVHYLMLGVPFVAVAVTVGAAEVARELPDRWRGGSLARLALVGLAALLLVADPERPDRFGAWPPRLMDASFEIQPWHGDRAHGVAPDLERLRELVKPGERLLVVPPYRNEVHLLLGTRGDASSEGYFFEPGTRGQLATILWDRVDAALVLEKGDAEWVEQWSIHKGNDVRAALPTHGFREVARLRTMSLWRRPANH